jgi:transposase
MSSVRQISVEGKGVFCGIDLHDRSMMAAIAVDKGPIEYKRYGTTEGDILELIGDLRLKGGEMVCVVYEASGQGFNLSDILAAEGFNVSVVAPTEIKRSVRGRRRKTDKEDARGLVKLVRSHVLAGEELPTVWVPDKQLRDEREIVRRRLGLGDGLTRAKNRIHGLLKRHGIRRPEVIKTLWSHKHLAWLCALAETLPCGTAGTLASVLREVMFLFEERDRLDEALVTLASGPRYEARARSLQSVPGVGMLTAMVYLTEMGDPRRFDNRRKVGSWLGLTPRCHESGEATDRKGHISRLGPARVRKVLNQAAWALVRTDKMAHAWYEHQTLKHNKPPKKVIVALMRKLGIVLWHRAVAV